MRFDGHRADEHRAGQDSLILVHRAFSFLPLAGIGEALGDKVDVVVIYNVALENGKMKMQCSFRSRKGFDTRKISTRFGGGGHVGSSGAAIPIETLDLTPIFESIEHYATLELPPPPPSKIIQELVINV